MEVMSIEPRTHLRSLVRLAFVLVLGFVSQTTAAQIVINPVVPSARLSGYTHGQFPSVAGMTHVGVDLSAACGQEIFTFADGVVRDVVSIQTDRNYSSLGYMVLIEHPALLQNLPFYTIYLHMQNPPFVTKNESVIGGETLLGLVGDTGAADGCHTHFEIRYFADRFSAWGNIYGTGDLRQSSYLKNSWEDPLDYFTRYPDGLTDRKNDVGPIGDESDLILPPIGPPPPLRESNERAPEVYVIVEEPPQLIGGLSELQKRISYPDVAKRAGIQGRVFVQFIVDENGFVTEPVVTRGIGGGCDEEAVQALLQSRFIPGRQRGKPVKVKMSMPVTFTLR